MKSRRPCPACRVLATVACPHGSSARSLPGSTTTRAMSSRSAPATTSRRCRRSSVGPNGSTAASSSICPAASSGTESGNLPATLRSGRRSGQAQRPAVDGCRDQGLLPLGSVTGPAADGGRPERRARGGHCGRIGRAAAKLDFGSLPGRRKQRHLPGQRAGKARPQASPGRPVEQLIFGGKGKGQERRYIAPALAGSTAFVGSLQGGDVEFLHSQHGRECPLCCGGIRTAQHVE